MIVGRTVNHLHRVVYPNNSDMIKVRFKSQINSPKAGKWVQKIKVDLACLCLTYIGNS